MAKSLETTWNIAEPGMHSIGLHVDGGWFSDTFRVRLDGAEMLLTKVSGGESGSHQLLVDGRPLELRWKWSSWTGKPERIALVDSGRILASYGSDASKLVGPTSAEHPVGGAAAKALSSLVSLVTVVALVGFMFFVPIRTCPHCAGIGSFIVKCQACEGNGKQTVWQILRSEVLTK
jgi:hypothetical protein